MWGACVGVYQLLNWKMGTLKLFISFFMHCTEKPNTFHIAMSVRN